MKQEGEGSQMQTRTGAGGCTPQTTCQAGTPRQEPNTATSCAQGLVYTMVSFTQELLMLTNMCSFMATASEYLLPPSSDTYIRWHSSSRTQQEAGLV